MGEVQWLGLFLIFVGVVAALIVKAKLS